MDRITKHLVLCLEIVNGVVLCALALITILGVFDRFLLHIGFFWTEEFARFSFIWLGFLAGAMMLYYNGHFNCSYFVDKLLSNHFKQILEIAISIMLIGMTAFLLHYGFKSTRMEWDQITATLRVPMGLVYCAVPVSSTIIIFLLVIKIYQQVMGLKRSNTAGG